MTLYNLINNISNYSLFKYIIIIIIIIILYRFLNINFNLILSFVLALFIIIYIHQKNNNSLSLIDNKYKIKNSYIKPTFNYIDDIEERPLIDFLFSIQDLYIYNPQSYEDMIDNINSFLELYNIIFKNDFYKDFYYQLAVSKKNNALNALHSIIFHLPVDNNLTDKFNRSHKRLETLLNKYLNLLYDQVQHHNISNGLNIFSRNIVLGPKEANIYVSDNYQFY